MPDQDSVLTSIAASPALKTAPSHLISALFSTSNVSTGTGISDFFSLLPPYEHAQLILKNYTDNVQWLYHVCHRPTVQSQMAELYQQAEAKPQGASETLSRLALIFTILSCSTYYWNPQEGLDYSYEEAKLLSRRWTSASEKILAEIVTKGTFSIDAMQAVILMTTLIPNAGASTSYLILVSALAHFGRALGLHQIDSKKAQEERKLAKNVDYVELEVKRRIWWHVCSTDWIMSYMSGPQLGSYNIHPRHFNVLPPSNVDDDAITPDGNYAQPLTVPTEISYFLTRNTMGEFCKNIVDATAAAGISSHDALDYDTVLAFDRMFDDAFKSLPYFYQRDATPSAAVKEIYRDRPYISHSRSLLHIGWNTRLARLHRPYLARGSKDPRYAYSRMTCLRAARTVVEIKRNMDTQEPKFMPSVTRVWTVIHHTFMATVILLMDLCYNWNDPQAQERKEEVLECCRILEKSRADSVIADRGIHMLMGILKRWKERNEGPECRDASSTQPLNSGPPPYQTPKGLTTIGDVISGSEKGPNYPLPSRPQFFNAGRTSASPMAALIPTNQTPFMWDQNADIPPLYASIVSDLNLFPQFTEPNPALSAQSQQNQPLSQPQTPYNRQPHVQSLAPGYPLSTSGGPQGPTAADFGVLNIADMNWEELFRDLEDEGARAGAEASLNSGGSGDTTAARMGMMGTDSGLGAGVGPEGTGAAADGGNVVPGFGVGMRW